MKNNNIININKEFWRYVLPTTGALVVSALYSVVDAVFVGHYVGEDGLSAVNMGWPLIAIVLGVGLMLGVGSGAASSIERGRKDLVRASSYIIHYFWLVLIFTLPCSFFIIYLQDFLLTLQNAIPTVEEMSKEYLEVFSYFSLAMLGSISTPMIVRNLNAPLYATLSVVAGAVTNIFLDWLFIAKFGLGVRGAAIATVISESITTLVCLAYIFSHYNPIRPTLKLLCFKFSYLIHISKLGLSSMVTYIYVGFIIIYYNRLLMEHGGVTYVASEAIIGYILGIFYMLTEGIGSGIQPLTSYFFGAKEILQVKKVLRLGLKVGLIVGLLFMLPCLLFPHFVVKVFTTDTKLIEVASYAIRLNMSMLFLEGLIVIISMFFQAIGLAGKSLFITTANMLIKFPFLTLFAYYWGAKGVWLVSPICDIIVITTSIYLLFGVLKKLSSLENMNISSHQVSDI